MTDQTPQERLAMELYEGDLPWNHPGVPEFVRNQARKRATAILDSDVIRELQADAERQGRRQAANDLATSRQRAADMAAQSACGPPCTSDRRP